MPPKFYQDLKVEVNVRDENDNAPKFPKEKIELEILENTRASISLDRMMAYDPDIGKLHVFDLLLSKNSKNMIFTEKFRFPI